MHNRSIEEKLRKLEAFEDMPFVFAKQMSKEEIEKIMKEKSSEPERV